MSIARPDHSTPILRDRWPSKEEHLTDTFNLRSGERVIRFNRSAACLLVRRRIFERGLTLYALTSITDISPSVLRAMVKGHRTIGIGDDSEALEQALGIEPGRIKALEQAATDQAVRSYDRVIERLREETAPLAAELFRRRRPTRSRPAV